MTAPAIPSRRSNGRTAVDIDTEPAAEPERSRGVLHDVWVIARRGLIHMKRQPEQLSDATIQPIMFVAMFAYVFGGSIRIAGPAPGGVNVSGPAEYREFLLAGIMAQTLVFTAFGVALSIANDRKNQAVDRFRAMPIARGAVLGGHAVANLIKAILPICIMSITGLVIGWRIRGNLLETLGAFGLALAFAFAMIWIGVLLGSVVATPEGVNGIAFVVLFPLTFVASTFVPVAGMPGPLRTVAQWNPITTMADSLRELFGNPNTPVRPGDPWSISHPVAYTLIWIVLIVVVVAPLAVVAYNRTVAD